MDRKENIKLVRGGRRRKEEEEGREEGDIKHAMFISSTEPLLITTDQTKWKEKAFCRRRCDVLPKSYGLVVSDSSGIMVQGS